MGQLVLKTVNPAGLDWCQLEGSRKEGQGIVVGNGSDPITLAIGNVLLGINGLKIGWCHRFDTNCGADEKFRSS